MKKNGFIATSLIYSFFLIFITLFLSVIADYLQDKVLLNEIEKGIKSDINNTMGIRDFEVGDMIGITDDCSNLSTDLNNIPLYTVVNVLINNSTICGDENNCLILYGVELKDVYSDAVDFQNIQDDIYYGYQNNTYYNKIIYNFDTQSSDSNTYSLGNGYNVYRNDSTECNSEVIVDPSLVIPDYSTDYNCIKQDNESNDLRRERVILKESKEESEGTSVRFEKCVSNEETGMIYIEK